MSDHEGEGAYEEGFVSFEQALSGAVKLIIEAPEVTPEIRALRQLRYPDYLQSPHWRETRKRALARAGGHCQRCGESRALEVHHVTYIRIGCEHDADMQALCSVCHSAEHGRAPR